MDQENNLIDACKEIGKKYVAERLENGARTQDPLLKREMLYQLSYAES
jgi:hypothetical protein